MIQIKKWADRILQIGVIVAIISLLLWLLSIPLAGFQIWTSGSFWGIFLRVLVSIGAIGLIYLGIKNKEQYVHTMPEDGLDVQISPEVYKTLISRVLANYDGVELDEYSFRPAQTDRDAMLYVVIRTMDPFSISEIVRNLKDKVQMTLAQSVGTSMNLQVVIRVKPFEVSV